MEINKFPLEILHYISQFLSEQDCLSFSISSVCERFSSIHGDKRNLSVSKCHFLTANSFHSFFTSWVFPSNISCFDASSCYWLPVDLLLNSISLMNQLNELYIQDTKLNLIHLSQVFENCKTLSTLGFTVVEETLDDIHVDRELLVQGFSKLSCIKLHAVNATYYIDSWLVTLPLLGWCKNCLELYIEVSYTEDYFRYGPYGKDDYDEDIIRLARRDLFPGLTWISQLQKLVIIKRGCGMSTSYPDEMVNALLKWMFLKYKMKHLDLLWIQEHFAERVTPDIELDNASMQSINMGANFRFDDTEERFRTLQHIGGIGFSEMAHLPCLRYIRGYCISEEGLNQFCQKHPSLEYLHINDNNSRSFSLHGNWKLKKLKTLVYTCSFPEEGVLRKMVDACPNIQHLHIGYSNRSAFDPWTSAFGIDFLSVIKFQRLRNLSLSAFDLFDGAFFETIFIDCPQLESLHLCGGFNRSKSYLNLCKFLPLATNLQDFRLQWAKYEDPCSVSLLLQTLLRCKTRLRRLVLYQQEMDCAEELEWRPADLPGVSLQTEFLFNFAERMEHLIAFCLSVNINHQVSKILVTRFIQEIIPNRPAFWFHLGSSLPRPNDSHVPRVHYDEIISPINYFDSPPKFH